MTIKNDDFFGNAPENYEVPKSESRYLKFKQPGNYKLRILQKPIFGWEAWTVDESGKDKPVRFAMNQKPADTSPYKRGEINHFWAMPVWNYNTGRVEVLSVTQKSIQEAIEHYARNEDWGSPLGYNLTITRTGTGLADTKYTVTASPHTPLAADIQAAWDQTLADGFNINALMTGDDPFAPSTGNPQHVASEAPQAPQTAPVAQPTPVAAPAPVTHQNASQPATEPAPTPADPNQYGPGTEVANPWPNQQ